jgi:hypothetical protein
VSKTSEANASREAALRPPGESNGSGLEVGRDIQASGTGRRPASSSLVLALQGLFVVGLYWPTLRLELLSDAWALIEQGSHGFRYAVSTTVGWHYTPVITGIRELALSVIGTGAAAWQAATLVLHLAVGYLVYRLGLTLFDDFAIALTASLIFLGSASFYEATFWPMVGCGYPLAAVPFLLGLEVALRMARGDSVPSGRWRLAGWLLIGVLCYPGMVTLLPLAGIALVFGRLRGKEARAWRDPKQWLWIAKALLPSIATLVVPMLARLHFSKEMASATSFRFDWVRAYWFDRSVLSVLSLRGSEEMLASLVTLGTQLRSGPVLHTFIWGWFLLIVSLLVWSVWRSRSLAWPLLLCWLVLQLGLTTLSLLTSSRHTYLAAIPAALLTAAALRVLGERLGRRLQGARAALVRVAPVMLGALVLLLGAQVDLRRALDTADSASDATRQMITAIRGVSPERRGGFTLTLVDMPSIYTRRGVNAYAFTNGLPEMVKIVSGRDDVVVELRCTGPRPINLASGSRPLAASELQALASDPGRVVLIFESRNGTVRRLRGADAAGPMQRP